MKIEIWSEGYAFNSDTGRATKHGEYEAENFDQAVEMYNLEHANDEWKIEKDKHGRYIYWACRVFDNETDARRNFG